MFWRIAVLLLAGNVLFGQRVNLTVAGGSLDPFLVSFVVWVAVGGLLHPSRIAADAKGSVAGLALASLLALSLLFPVLGVLIGWYELKHLYAVVGPLAIIAILRLRKGVADGANIRMVGFILILGHGLYGLLQTLHRFGVVSDSVWAPFSAWDASSQLARADSYLILGRSTGLFVNANLFGAWSCFAIVFSIFLLRGRRRVVGIILGFLGVVGSQSRTAWVALAAILLVMVVLSALGSRFAKQFSLVCVAATVVGAVVWPVGAISGLLETDFVARLSSGLRVIEDGVVADANLQARVLIWRDALKFSSGHPLGTLGPPELLLGSFIDNQYVALFLQGGPVLLAAYVVTLISPLWIKSRNAVEKSGLILLSAVAAIFSLTQLPFYSVSASALCWLMIAAVAGENESTTRQEITPPDDSTTGLLRWSPGQ